MWGRQECLKLSGQILLVTKSQASSDLLFHSGAHSSCRKGILWSTDIHRFSLPSFFFLSGLTFQSYFINFKVLLHMHLSHLIVRATLWVQWISFERWGTWGLEEIKPSPNVTQVEGQTRDANPDVLFQGLDFQPQHCIASHPLLLTSQLKTEIWSKVNENRTKQLWMWTWRAGLLVGLREREKRQEVYER